MTFSLPIDGIVDLLGFIERHYLEFKAEALKERLNQVHLRSGPPAHVSDGIGGARGQHREAPVRDTRPVDEVEQALSQAHVGVRSAHIVSPLARRRPGPAGSNEPGTLPEPFQGGSLFVCLLRFSWFRRHPIGVRPWQPSTPQPTREAVIDGSEDSIHNTSEVGMMVNPIVVVIR